MRLTIREKPWDHHPAADVELPKDASASIYATGAFASLMLSGITPVQLHDAIGCTAIKFTGERRAAYLGLVAEEIRLQRFVDACKEAKEEAR